MALRAPHYRQWSEDGSVLEHLLQKQARLRTLLLPELRRATLPNNLPTAFTALRSHIDDPVGLGYHIQNQLRSQLF